MVYFDVTLAPQVVASGNVSVMELDREATSAEASEHLCVSVRTQDIMCPVYNGKVVFTPFCLIQFVLFLPMQAGRTDLVLN
jgi:hypothetical protein